MSLLEHIPPQSLEAEQAVLGAMLMERDAISLVVDVLQLEDFYSPQHQMLYRVMVDMFNDSEPVDLVTVQTRLQNRGQLEEGGGTSYLLALQESAPTAASISHYAAIVKDKATLRALIRAGREIQELAQGAGDEDVQLLVAQAQKVLQALGGRADMEGFQRWRDVLGQTIDELSKQMDDERHTLGISTGIQRLDSTISGWQPGTYYLVAARPSVGKALALDTLIPTPDGFTPIGNMHIGDRVFDERGGVCRVTYVSPIYLDHRCYRITFSDGATVIADADHQWEVRSRRERKRARGRVAHPDPDWTRRFPQCRPRSPLVSVRTTTDIAETFIISEGDGRTFNYAVDVAGAFQAEDADLPIPPYVLGVWLGDGNNSCARITTADEEVLEHIRSEGVPVGIGRHQNSGRALAYTLSNRRRGGSREAQADSLQGRLRAGGLLGNKHIPRSYLFASPGQRLALLQGLMDTDGTCGVNGRCELYTSSERMARDFLRLVSGLGIKASLRRKAPPVGTQHGESYRINFLTAVPVFRLERKASRQRQDMPSQSMSRSIVGVEEVEREAVRCIAVDSPSHLYLCTDHFIPTHNTAFALAQCGQVASLGAKVAMFSLEMTRQAMARRHLARSLEIDLSVLTSARFDRDRMDDIVRVSAETQDWDFYICERSDLRIGRLRAEARQLARRVGGLDFIAVDYIQLVAPDTRGRSRNDEITEISAGLKAMCLELDCSLVALSQLSRDSEKERRLPRLSDLRDSGSLEQDADVVIFLSWPTWLPEFQIDGADGRPKPNKNLRRVDVAKQRNGPARWFDVAWSGAYQRFADLERDRDDTPWWTEGS